jgi:hypothetical protein
MRIVNFAQGALVMLGTFASFYLVTGGKALSFLGPLISRVSGLRTAGSHHEGRCSWFGHDSIFPYAHVMIFKEALERTASTDRRKLGEMMHKIDLEDGPAKLFPDGRVKYDDNGRRVGAELCIVQWQKGRPVGASRQHRGVKAVWPKLS